MTREAMRWSRRGFLRRVGLAGAAPYVITSSALGGAGRPAASERIVMGGIGLGGRGSGDLRWLLGQGDVQFVAVCDVQGGRRAAAREAVNRRNGDTSCAAYRDFRELLAARGDIDAMLIATGDRWHALASILAMKAGKDVYCEKPGTMTVAEGRALVETAWRYGQVFQTGAQRLSEMNFIFATELARNGRLGKLHTVRAHLWPAVKDVTRNHCLPPQPEPPVEELDWDLWLGPAPWRPYNRGYLHGCGAWGVYWDFGAGIAGWGSHTIIQCHAAAGAEYTSPVEYTFPGNRSGDALVAKFANGVKLVMQFAGWRGSCGVRFEGTDGWTSVADGYARPDVSDARMLADFRRVVNDYAARTGRPFNHLRDFLSCVKSRRATVANPEATHRSMTTNHVINICLALGRDVKWDPEAERFVGDDEANRYLARAMREPWRV